MALIVINEVIKSTQINMIFSYKKYVNKRCIKPLLSVKSESYTFVLIRGGKVMSIRELSFVVQLLLLIQLSLNQSLPLTSYDKESIEDLKYFFLNRKHASSFRFAVCGLTRANKTITVNWKWMTELANHNISAYIMQDNDYNHMSHNGNITSISIAHQLSLHAGYNRGGNMYYKDKAIENGEVVWGKYTIPNSWDKALFYFAAIDQHYEFV